VRCLAIGSTQLSTANESALASAASSSIGLRIVLRELPDAAITASSESWFIAERVCEIPMMMANGITTGITVGRSSVASSRNVPAVWPLSVTMLTLARICVVHAMASATNSAAPEIFSAR
jgi:hypothetical protein